MIYIKAAKEDGRALQELRLAYLNEDYGTLSEDTTERIKSQLPGYFQAHLNEDLFAYIAKSNDEAVASVFLFISEKPANPSFITGKTGTILNVYTNPNYRRQGIAKQLMEMAIAHAKELGLSYLELQATKDGAPLYRSIGFETKVSHYEPMRLNLLE